MQRVISVYLLVVVDGLGKVSQQVERVAEVSGSATLCGSVPQLPDDLYVIQVIVYCLHQCLLYGRRKISWVVWAYSTRRDQSEMRGNNWPTRGEREKPTIIDERELINQKENLTDQSGKGEIGSRPIRERGAGQSEVREAEMNQWEEKMEYETANERLKWNPTQERHTRLDEWTRTALYICRKSHIRNTNEKQLNNKKQHKKSCWRK